MKLDRRFTGALGALLFFATACDDAFLPVWPDARVVRSEPEPAPEPEMPSSVRSALIYTHVEGWDNLPEGAYGSFALFEDSTFNLAIVSKGRPPLWGRYSRHDS